MADVAPLSPDVAARTIYNEHAAGPATEVLRVWGDLQRHVLDLGVAEPLPNGYWAGFVAEMTDGGVDVAIPFAVKVFFGPDSEAAVNAVEQLVACREQGIPFLPPARVQLLQAIGAATERCVFEPEHPRLPPITLRRPEVDLLTVGRVARMVRRDGAQAARRYFNDVTRPDGYVAGYRYETLLRMATLLRSAESNDPPAA